MLLLSSLKTLSAGLSGQRQHAPFVAFLCFACATRWPTRVSWARAHENNPVTEPPAVTFTRCSLFFVPPSSTNAQVGRELGAKRTVRPLRLHLRSLWGNRGHWPSGDAHAHPDGARTVLGCRELSCFLYGVVNLFTATLTPKSLDRFRKCKSQ